MAAEAPIHALLDDGLLPGGLFARWAHGGTRYHACLLKESDRPLRVVTESLCGRCKRTEWRDNVVHFIPWDEFADRAYNRAEACPRCAARAAGFKAA
jgi:hypothetical protein